MEDPVLHVAISQHISESRSLGWQPLRSQQLGRILRQASTAAYLMELLARLSDKVGQKVQPRTCEIAESEIVPVVMGTAMPKILLLHQFLPLDSRAVNMCQMLTQYKPCIANSLRCSRRACGSGNFWSELCAKERSWRNKSLQ